jgi:phage tail-like protein
MARPGIDPQLAFCFKVTIKSAGLDGATALFKSVGGLSVETAVVEYREGGRNDTTHKLVGETKYKNIVLKRGYAGDQMLDWHTKWVERGIGRVTGTIEQLDTKGTAVAAWEFSEAWPVKWEMSEFDASKNEVSIETLEIAHEGIKQIKKFTASKV